MPAPVFSPHERRPYFNDRSDELHDEQQDLQTVGPTDPRLLGHKNSVSWDFSPDRRWGDAACPVIACHFVRVMFLAWNIFRLRPCQRGVGVQPLRIRFLGEWPR